MKKSILIVLSVLLVTIGMAQTRVTGKVTSSDDGSPVPYATIQVKGVSGVGATTDLDGKFILPNVSGNATLIISYIATEHKRCLLTAVLLWM